MADNRIYIVCRLCKDMGKDYVRTLAHFNYTDGWTSQLDVIDFVSKHSHIDDDEYWGNGNYMKRPFAFEYEDESGMQFPNPSHGDAYHNPSGSMSDDHVG